MTEDVTTARDAASIVIPKREFGQTGVKVSKLCLGGSSVVGSNACVLIEEALKCGIDCWEFNPFTGRAFGDYFGTHPGLRERVFLSAKARSPVPAVMESDLDRALSDNDTSFIDFFAVHGVDNVDVLTDDVRRWAENAKAKGKIRFFGFCTHKRMAKCLDCAATLGWIDGIQAFYNFRMRATGGMDDALRKCHENGIGIFVVKSMGLCVKDEAKLQGLPLPMDRVEALLVERGLSFAQAKLRAIWGNPHLTSVCSLMPSVSILHANALAALDERPLDIEIARLLEDYAACTQSCFCRRCGTCDTATSGSIPIFNVMESLMYARSYGARELAAKVFAQIPAELRGRMRDWDYSIVERECPQRLPIAQLVGEALAEFDA